MREEALSRAQSLAGIPLFAGVEDARDESALEGSPWAELAAQATRKRMVAGEWLWHEGDAGDSLYVVLTGRLEVVDESAEARVIRAVGRGDAVGEVALLTGLPRSAGVRAARDCELLRVAAADFSDMVERRPDFARALTRVLGLQLRDVRATGHERNPLPATVALVPLEPDLPVT
jgi:CRP-like cAMP-binding protein